MGDKSAFSWVHLASKLAAVLVEGAALLVDVRSAQRPHGPGRVNPLPPRLPFKSPVSATTSAIASMIQTTFQTPDDFASMSMLGWKAASLSPDLQAALPAQIKRSTPGLSPGQRASAMAATVLLS